MLDNLHDSSVGYGAYRDSVRRPLFFKSFSDGVVLVWYSVASN